MSDFRPVYIPVGVPTFHLESAQDLFEKSIKLLRGIDNNIAVPEEMLLSVDKLNAYTDGLDSDFVIFQNNTFANAAYMEEVIKRFDCPVLIWTLREPAADGGRLRLNSLTGAYSAANMMRTYGRADFDYVFGSPGESGVAEKIAACLKAAKIIKKLRGMNVCSIGEPPQGFAFGHAEDKDLAETFGIHQFRVSISEILDRAKSYTDEECLPYLRRSRDLMSGLEIIPEENLKRHARLYRAYKEYTEEYSIEAVASRCWPDFFTEYATPVCAVLSILNDDGTAAACEADMYGAISMRIGMDLSGGPVFFGDPASLDEDENTLTFWHCGAAACGLARKDTGAVTGVHPNRKIGPVMDFGCEKFPEATVFRIGREANGSFRFFISEGEAIDKPKQFTGTSLVVRMDNPVREIVEKSILDGFEPHYVIIKGRHSETLKALAKMYGFRTCIY